MTRFQVLRSVYMFNQLLLAIIFLCLTACIAVKDSVAQLDRQFVAHADQVLLKTSSVKVSAGRFNQTFLEYQITHTRQSWQTLSSSRLVASNSTHVLVDSDIIDWALFGRKYPYDYSYEINNKVYQIETQSRFWFDLQSQSQTQSQESVKASCGNFYLEEKGVTYYSGRPAAADVGLPSAGSTHRLNTFVFCKFDDGRQPWYLSLDIPDQGKPTMDFTDNPSDWTIVPVLNFDQYLANGETLSSRELPGWKKMIAGFEILYRNKTIGAISTIGKPRLWLHKDAGREQRDKVTGLMYAMFIVNDIDREWLNQVH